VQVNSISGICLTKLDVLDGLETLKVCTHYKLKDGTLVDLPVDASAFVDVEPVYVELAGWSESTVGAKQWVSCLRRPAIP